MTDITQAAATKTGALSTLRLAELQQLASSMGISVNSRMRKADLVSAIRERRGGGGAAASSTGDDAVAKNHSNGGQRRSEKPASQAERSEPRDSQHQQSGSPNRQQGSQDPQPQGAESLEAALDRAQAQRDGGRNQEQGARDDGGHSQGGERNRPDRDGQRHRQGDGQGDNDNQRQQSGNDNQGEGQGGEGGRRRRRNRQRGRDRKRPQTQNRPGGGQQQPVETYTEDDVLVPVGGVLDLLDNYAFIRTTGYLPGPTDVYVPMGMVRKNSLRKGDAVTGAIKAPTEGSDANQHTVSSTGNKRDKGKFSALVRLDTVNGQSPEEAGKRPDFGRLTPLYPQDRLRLETDQKNLTTRAIDLVAPIGKGQRGLIVSPAKAGKTMIMQNIANAIAANNPEVHLMIVLVDERPEEVTDFERNTKGEVISSTFDRPASDHTMVAELAIERAKRLVEMGQDVMVLLDGITRLGRAYNLAAPASGRILSGGVDSAALYPPKKFFGAARNIEDGGSLTILATALIESGSKMDEVIFEEFKGTGNMELRLSRQLADRRTFPAVDVNSSGTRREEILMSNEELKIVWKLRRVLSALDQQQGIELLLDRLRKTKHNYEFLTQVQQTSSIKLDDDE